MRARRLLPYAVLAGGVVVVSTASILIRVAQSGGAPSLTIAAFRLGVAALILTPFALRAAAPVAPRDLALALVSGAFLAGHFWSWISSLAHTSVASSTALVTTNPLWVGLASLLIFRERLAPALLAGIALCFGGAGLIFVSDEGAVSHAPGGDPTFGNLLALIGAVCASGYLLIGRALRTRMSLLQYVWLAYSSAAVLLWLAVASTGAAVLGLAGVAYWCMLGLAVGPQLIGHTAFNWSLRHLSATFVAVSILGEPIGSALLAWLAFDEGLDRLQLLGFVLILGGIAMAALAERAAPTPQTSTSANAARSNGT
jgi:drug/metabolite transporter (DMT)-like permease